MSHNHKKVTRDNFTRYKYIYYMICVSIGYTDLLIDLIIILRLVSAFVSFGKQWYFPGARYRAAH